MMEARGRTAAADALGMNYRTVVANLDADRLSRRMRTAVQRGRELPDAGVVTLESQPDEEHALWAGCRVGGRVAWAADRRCEPGQRCGKGGLRSADGSWRSS